MFVKICGTTNLADAELAVELGADALGFIFAPSKRRVTVEGAREIARRLPGGVLAVGVFTEPTVDEIIDTAFRARLSAVQMHWPYDPQVIDSLVGEFENACELWQIVGFEVEPSDQDESEARFREEFRAALGDGRLDCILLDAVKGGASGGQGRAFAWRRAAAIVKPLMAEAEVLEKEGGRRLPRLVVAGGLNPENVQEAIGTLRPWGVDVVSGVEASAGRKSPDRLRAFFASVRAQS